MNFNKTEKKILAVAQSNLPESLTPYLDIANACDCTEGQVLDLLRKLKLAGTIRRFGASLKHQKAGWDANAMIAWQADREEADIWAPRVVRHPQISHAYFRPSDKADWPYTLYTMVHARNFEGCREVIHYLQNTWPFQKYIILQSLRELKKISMNYFNQPED